MRSSREDRRSEVLPRTSLPIGEEWANAGEFRGRIPQFLKTNWGRSTDLTAGISTMSPRFPKNMEHIAKRQLVTGPPISQLILYWDSVLLELQKRQ